MKINLIQKVKDELKIEENFSKSESGTRSDVYLSDNFVIKINKDIELLKREKDVLDLLDSPLAPKVKRFIQTDGKGAIIENKLQGKSIQDEWKNLCERNKDIIIGEIISFISSIHNIKNEKFWAAQYGIKSMQYSDLLLYKLNKNKEKILSNEISKKLYSAVSENVTRKKVNNIFGDVKPTLVHGDLIMHNLLTNGANLTGILDWEFAQYGDPYYDLARVIYYQECAKAYIEEKRDEHFEYDFTSRLISGLEKIIAKDEAKYKIIRSIYFIDSIIWALNSDNPEKHLSTLHPPIF